MLGLKSFHVFFILASIALCLAVGAWGVQQYRMTGGGSGLIMAGIFLASAVVLVVYAIRYFGKLRALD